MVKNSFNLRFETENIPISDPGKSLDLNVDNKVRSKELGKFPPPV